jgi:hypothetical protein
MKKSYLELLKDPRWQKKRLEVMEQNDFKCEECGESKNTLNVHHGYYGKDLMPWEYETTTLHCLCEDCHMMRHDVESDIKYTMSLMRYCQLERVIGYCASIALDPIQRKQLSLISSHANKIGQCDACRKPDCKERTLE